MPVKYTSNVLQILWLSLVLSMIKFSFVYHHLILESGLIYIIFLIIFAFERMTYNKIP